VSVCGGEDDQSSSAVRFSDGTSHSHDGDDWDALLAGVDWDRLEAETARPPHSRPHHSPAAHTVRQYDDGSWLDCADLEAIEAAAQPPAALHDPTAAPPPPSLDLEYWQRWCQREGSTAAAPVVRVASAQWERQQWQRSLICAPPALPLWLADVVARHASLTTEAVVREQERWDVHAQAIPPVHPLTGARLLYVAARQQHSHGAAASATRPAADRPCATAGGLAAAAAAAGAVIVKGVVTADRPAPLPPLEEALCMLVASLSACGGVAGAPLRIKAWQGVRRNNSSPADGAGEAAMWLRMDYELCGTGSRWCEVVGRCHRSNGVVWSVDVGTRVAWQRCWDADCAAVRRGPTWTGGAAWQL